MHIFKGRLIPKLSIYFVAEKCITIKKKKDVMKMFNCSEATNFGNRNRDDLPVLQVKMKKNQDSKQCNILIAGHIQIANSYCVFLEKLENKLP